MCFCSRFKARLIFNSKYRKLIIAWSARLTAATRPSKRFSTSSASGALTKLSRRLRNSAGTTQPSTFRNACADSLQSSNWSGSEGVKQLFSLKSLFVCGLRRANCGICERLISPFANAPSQRNFSHTSVAAKPSKEFKCSVNYERPPDCRSTCEATKRASKHLGTESTDAR